MFRLAPSECDGADVTVIESPEAYDRVWLARFAQEYVPKFLVSSWLTAAAQPDTLYVGGFLLSPNLWHGDNGPGEHAARTDIHRWIAWHVPPHARSIVEHTLSQKSNAGPHDTCLARRDLYAFDSSMSDIPMLSKEHPGCLHTVRDLTVNNLPALRELKRVALQHFSARFGAAEGDVAIYAHYPVRPRLSLLHFHVCLGHREEGALAARSHNLADVIRHLEKWGRYSDSQRFAKYHLNGQRDKSLQTILEELGDTSPVEVRLDVVIPCAPKDAQLLPLCLSSLRSCCRQIRRIVVVSPTRLVEEADAEWFDESLFPFAKVDLGTGWRYQQALKLCASFAIPDLLDNVLLVDADTVWHRRSLEFVAGNGAGLYATSTSPGDVNGYDKFFETVLMPLGLRREHEGLSAITHHMLVQRSVLARLFHEIRDRFGMPVWRVFSEGKPSEWELYYHYAVARFPERVSHRPLRFMVTGDIHEAQHPPDSSVDFAVCHSHRRHGFIDTHDDGDYHDRM